MVKQFNNILVIAPLHKQLLSQAVGLMASSQSKMTLMAIVPHLEDPQVTSSDGQAVDVQQLLIHKVKADLQQAADPLKAEDFRVKTVVSSSRHAFIEIINQVGKQKHDLVMMLADGKSSVREQLFGTLSMHLMRKCPCPVWVVKPTRRKKFRNVFAAVDPDPSDPVRDQLNVSVLKRAATIAHNCRAKLHVIHAWQALGPQLRSGRWVNSQINRLYVEKIAAAHHNRLSQLLKEHLDGAEIVHTLQGEPGMVIPEKIKDMKGDMLVLGTVCRTGIPGFFIGNTAETILHQVNCSVLTVKPEGFVSPVNQP